MTSDDKKALIRDESAAEEKGPKCGTRHVLALWAFLGFANLFVLRVDMSIALVAMARQPASNNTLPSNDSECERRLVSSEESGDDKAEFDWSNSLQGFVLSAFYYGYFLTQIPGGLLAKRVGGKRPFSLAMAGCSALSLAIPLAARLHVGLLIACRVVQGCLQGLVFPAMQEMLSHWAPGRERSRLVAFSFAGCQAGTVVGMLSAGYLCDTSLGWPIVFYIEGVLGLLWCVGWTCSTFDTPAVHPRISDSEKVYIENNLDRSQLTKAPVPWKGIFTSPALCATAAAHFANDWGCFAVMTCLPKFMKDILGFDMTQNGVLSSLPYLVTWVCNMLAGTLADFLRKPNRLRTVHVRKIMVTMGLIGPASLLLAAAYLPGCGRVAVVVLLTIAMGFSGFTVAGHSVNHLDIAPAFAGLLFAMTNCVGTTSGFIGPALAGALTEQHDTRGSWQTFFLISGAVYAFGGLVFVAFARGDIQAWAKVKDTDKQIVVSSSYGTISGPAGQGDGACSDVDDEAAINSESNNTQTLLR